MKFKIELLVIKEKVTSIEVEAETWQQAAGNFMRSHTREEAITLAENAPDSIIVEVSAMSHDGLHNTFLDWEQDNPRR